jgi:hypothetical protein
MGRAGGNMNKVSKATVTQAPASFPRHMTVEDTTSYVDVRSLNVYDFVDATYAGDAGFRDGTFLVPHPREAFYLTRRRSSYYVNAFKPIVNAMVDPVFKLEITRESKSDAMDSFVLNADNAGTPLQSIVHTAMQKARRCGLCFAVVDNVTSQELASVPTEKQAVTQRALPYTYIKRAQDCKKLTVDKYGKMETVTLYDGERIEAGKSTPQYRYWDAKVWRLVEYKMDDGHEVEVLVDEGAHNLGVVPVIAVNTFCESASLAKLPDPPLFDLAFLSFALFNKESLVVTLEQNQSFSIFYVSGYEGNNLVVSPTNFISVGDKAQFPPGFASPDAAHITNLVANCNRLQESIRALAQQNGVIGVVKESSGIAKEWDFRAEEAVLQRTATEAARLEMRIAELFDLYRNTKSGYTVTYPKQFSPTYSKERVDQALRIVETGVPPQAVSDAAWQEVVNEFWIGDEDTREEVTEAMDMEDDSERQSNIETEGADDVTPPPAGTDIAPDGLEGNAVTSQQVALNGAQVTSAVDVIKSVAIGELPRDSGIAILQVSFALSKDNAEAMMGSVGAGFTPTQPTDGATQ